MEKGAELIAGIILALLMCTSTLAFSIQPTYSQSDTMLTDSGLTPISHIKIDGDISVFSQKPADDERFERFGPRVDNLLIKIYNETCRVFEGIENGEVDVIDRALTPVEIERWSKTPYNETIALAEYMEMIMYELDINNNETIPTYPDWISPTSYQEFRHAIAHLVNRTEILTEILNGSGVLLTTPVWPWLEKWFNPNADSHPYDPPEAATILDVAGFVQGTTENPDYDSSKPGSAQFIRVYPPDHEKAGQDLDELIFYARHDDPRRFAAAEMIRDELLSIGIPVYINPPILQVIEIIRRYGDYHLFTGGWLLSLDPAYLYWLYHSSQYGPGYTYPNYNNVHDDELDYWLEKLFEATSQEEAVMACREAQRRFAEIVGTVPLWGPVGTTAYRKDLEGVANEENLGVNSWWTFLNAHQQGVEHGGTIRYGLSQDVRELNPVFSAWMYDWSVLDKIYDTLIRRNPYNITQEIPWMAEDWEVGTWEGNRTKLVFHLREDIYWHDGVKFTSEDVKFTIEYLLSFWDNPMWSLPLPTCYYSVADVQQVETPDPYTVVIYESVSGIWALSDIGGIPILPKHIWENITDPLGFAPDPQLIGTGPFKFVEYAAGKYILLGNNTEYFRCCPIQTTVEVESRIVPPGSSTNFTVTIHNCYADKEVNTTVYIYFDEKLVHNQTLALEAYTAFALETYDTGPLPVGLHEIKLEHDSDPILGRNCTYTKSIWATIYEDLNRDGKVDGKDLATAAKAFGTKPGHERWRSIADVNGDNKVDGKDIAALAKRFGWVG